MRDKLGIFFSGLCVVHCLLNILLIFGGVGSASIFALSEDLIHPLLLFFVVIIGLMSFPSGYKKHNKPHPSSFGVLGPLGLMNALIFNSNTEIVFTLIFGTTIVYALFWHF
mgnify:CR=1 FL=1